MRQLLADKVMGNLAGVWLLAPALLRLGAWDLVRSWTTQRPDQVEPRLALQLIHEAALCTTGLRHRRTVNQHIFESANGLPFLASDGAVHDLLGARTVADGQRFQVALGELRRASGDFRARLLAIDPHRVRSFSKRHMRRHRDHKDERPTKVAQTFFALDAETHQPVCFTTATAARTATTAAAESLDLAACILDTRPGQTLVVADAEHFTPTSAAGKSVTLSRTFLGFPSNLRVFLNLASLKSSLISPDPPLLNPQARTDPRSLSFAVSPGITAFADPSTWPGLANSPCNRATWAEGFAQKPHDNPGGPTMDDSFCHDFFAHPVPTLHRRYEALRAVFLDHRPLTEVARRFGYRQGTLRNLVAQSRARCRTGQIPPFSPPRLTDDPKEPRGITLPHNPIPGPRPIAINSFSHQAGASKREWPGSFSSSRSWPDSGAMTW